MKACICWIVLRWEIEQLNLRLPTSLKAAIFQFYILPTRALNASMNDMVQRTNIFILLREIWCHPYKTVENINQSLQLPEECMHIVNDLLHSRKFGWVDLTTVGLLDWIQHFWKQVSLTTSPKDRFMTRQIFVREMADLLVSNAGGMILKSSGLSNGRSASEPCIRHAESKLSKAKACRSRSLSLGSVL